MVEDEKHHPFSLITIGADGGVECTALKPGLLQLFSDFWKLDDLEGLALDRAGFVYAVTSHSRDEGGNEKPSRMFDADETPRVAPEPDVSRFQACRASSAPKV